MFVFKHFLFLFLWIYIFSDVGSFGAAITQLFNDRRRWDSKSSSFIPIKTLIVNLTCQNTNSKYPSVKLYDVHKPHFSHFVPL